MINNKKDIIIILYYILRILYFIDIIKESALSAAARLPV